MVQGATQMAARFPELLRMYKAPPPEVSSEQFYETDERRGFARGFSIQTVSPLPIGWAEHVLAEGHWGQALREYMRDYNHWTVLGILAEFMPLPENRVTLAADLDGNGMPVAHFNTRRSGLRIAAVMDHVVDGPPGTEVLAESFPHLARATVMAALEPGQRVRLVKFVAYGWSASRSLPAVRDQADGNRPAMALPRPSRRHGPLPDRRGHRPG